MIGAILGDIAGSDIEFRQPADFDYKTYPLFSDNKFFTDDTIMTIATKYAIDNNMSFAQAYQMFGRKYYNSGYGFMFREWIKSENPQPYNSYGNGSAMRVSYIGEHFNDLREVEKWAIASAECTHNHPEGIKGAVATAQCVYLARNLYAKSEIKFFVQRTFGYDVDTPLDEIRQNYTYDITCQGTVPAAIRCFLESDNYETCIRNVFSLKGDVDTMGAIAGAIAYAYYDITGFDDNEILNRYLDQYLLECLNGGSK